MPTQNAVLMLVFNRPELTKRVLDAVREAKPPRLYVSADGPRSGRQDDFENTAKVRHLFSQVDWPCEVITRFSTVNQGCRLGVSSGISWFFEHEEQGIVLEDDVLPHPDFFDYCDTLLERYKSNPKVMSICGANLVQPWYRLKASIGFTRYMCVWGWASWRRAWVHYDEKISDWPAVRSGQSAFQTSLQGFNKRFWRLVFDLVFQGRIGTWDHQWVYAHWKAGGCTVVPSQNLVLNLGFGPGATHTSGAVPDYVQQMSVSELPRPWVYPDQVDEDRALTDTISRRAHRVGLWTYVKLLVRAYPGVFQRLKPWVDRFRGA